MDFQLARRIVPAGEALEIRLQPWYAIPKLSGSYTVRLALKSGKGETVRSLPPIQIQETRDFTASLSTSGLAPGTYAVGYELVSPAGTIIVEQSRLVDVEKGLQTRVEALRKKLARITDAKIAAKGISQAAAVESLEYIVQAAERSLKEYVATFLNLSHPMARRLRGGSMQGPFSDPLNVARDLPFAEALAEGLLAGKTVLVTRTGDMRQAYRSAVDNTLQPYRVYVPKAYTPGRALPLVVALHGATGDENTYMDRYVRRATGENVFQRLGEDRGYILVTPNGRGAYGLYTGPAEKDVLDVLDRVSKIYSVVPGQVFLMGHSMGGQGTWVLGFKHPEKFAALAPVAGRPADLSQVAMKNAPDKPVLFCTGGRDNLATPESVKLMAEAASKDLKRFKHQVYPEDDHFVIGVNSLPAIFDFFDSLRGSPKP